MLQLVIILVVNIIKINILDIRNIKEIVPPLEVGTYLQSMYSLSLEQLDGYRQIEKLPDYPVDINNHQNQVVLKDFIARVIEELMEGYESTSEVVKICHKWGWNIDQLTEDEYTQVLNHLQNANLQTYYQKTSSPGGRLM